MKSKTLESFIKLIKSKQPKLDAIKSFLRSSDFDINELDNHGYNPLHYAILNSQPDIVYLLLNPSPDPKAKASESKENDPQAEDSQESNPLLSKKSNPNIETNDQQKKIYTSPLLLTLTNVDDETVSLRIIKNLIRSGANINYKDEDNSTLYLKACEKGRVDIVNHLLNLGDTLFDINDSSQNGGGLHMAILGQQDEMISFLLSKNIDLSIVNNDGNTAMHLCLIEDQMNNFKEIFDYIVDDSKNLGTINVENKKKLLNIKNKNGNTILHEIAYAGSSVLTNIVLKLPKEYAVDDTVKNKDGYDYKGVSEHLIQLKKEKQEQEKLEKENIRRQKMEIKKLKEEQENKILEERKKQKEKIERQNEFGEQLIRYRGIIFLFIFIFILGIIFLLVLNATKKKDIVI